MIEAVAQANQVAIAVDRWLTTGKLERVVYQPKRHDVPLCARLEEYAQARRARPDEVPPDWRISCGFAEVELGFDETRAREEAKRCLRCDLECLEPMAEPVPAAVAASADAESGNGARQKRKKQVVRRRDNA